MHGADRQLILRATRRWPSARRHSAHAPPALPRPRQTERRKSTRSARRRQQLPPPSSTSSATSTLSTPPSKSMSMSSSSSSSSSPPPPPSTSRAARHRLLLRVRTHTGALERWRRWSVCRRCPTSVGRRFATAPRPSSPGPRLVRQRRCDARGAAPGCRPCALAASARARQRDGARAASPASSAPLRRRFAHKFRYAIVGHSGDSGATTASTRSTLRPPCTCRCARRRRRATRSIRRRRRRG